MNVRTQIRDLPQTDQLETLIHKQARKVRKLLPTFADEDLDLRIQLDRLSTGKQFHAVAVLSLPQRTIRVDAVESTLYSSVLRSFAELIRRVKKFKSRLNREQYWQRETTITSEPISAPSRPDVVEDAINENLDKIENYIRREIYHQAILQGLPPGILQPHAILDEVFLQVRNNPQAKPDNLAPEQWFFQLSRRVLREQIKELRRSGRQAHIEESPQARRDGIENQDLLSFYQPDESLRLEDVLRDNKIATPEEYLASEETEHRLQAAIAGLPEDEREVFVLFALEGFNSDEVAMITGKSASEVIENVKRSRERLEEALEH